jgi:uncharacterized membrane protein YeaQ/YmgE (transglycosylase-associated protein family)
MFFVVILSWIAVGLLVGFVATKAVNLRGDDPRLSMGATAVGGVAGGVIYSLISGTSFITWTLWAFVVAAIAAVVSSIVWHLVRSRSISRDVYVPRSSY